MAWGNANAWSAQVEGEKKEEAVGSAFPTLGDVSAKEEAAFPTLGAAAAIKEPKKKAKGVKLSLAEFAGSSVGGSSYVPPTRSGVSGY
ncbi:hypothetical protein BE221DRAFT_193182, partial [Ostreococcus tauri]